MVKGMTKIDTSTMTVGRQLSRFWADESGATAIEYAMVASGIGAFLAATVYTLGGKVKGLFTTLAGMF
jgi:pilus assembly protein Flp/PilA